jgi:hypothetical protein
MILPNAAPLVQGRIDMYQTVSLLIRHTKGTSGEETSMKPSVTWMVLVNARAAQVYELLGPDNGLTAVSDQSWRALDVPLPRGAAGVGHSTAKQDVSPNAVTQSNELADNRFAKDGVGGLAQACLRERFDRLILISGPYMMGLLRANLVPALSAIVIGEVPKDA